jgi:hypothetical protein
MSAICEIELKQQTDEDLGEIVPEDKFRLSNKKIHLTYAGWINPMDLYEFINSKYKIDLYSSVNETGKTGHKHTHFLVKFKETLEIRNSKFLDYEGIHPNIRKVSTLGHWENCINYHTKENKPTTNINNKKIKEIKEMNENSNKKPEIPDCNPENRKCSKYKIQNGKSCFLCKAIYNERTDKESIPISLTEIQQKYRTFEEAAADLCLTNGRQANFIRVAMDSKITKFINEPQVKFFKYQKLLFDLILMGEVDDRGIIWIKSIGGHGKSSFLKHMAAYYGVFVCTDIDTYHLATTLEDSRKRGNPIKTVIINLPRSETPGVEFYKGLEQIKDGFMTSKKYKGKPIIFNVPNIIIFCNTDPYKQALTEDKWDCREIVEIEDIYLKLKDGEIIKDLDFNIDENEKIKRETAIARRKKIKEALAEQGFSIPGHNIVADF